MWLLTCRDYLSRPKRRFWNWYSLLIVQNIMSNTCVWRCEHASDHICRVDTGMFWHIMHICYVVWDLGLFYCPEMFSPYGLRKISMTLSFVYEQSDMHLKLTIIWAMFLLDSLLMLVKISPNNWIENLCSMPMIYRALATLYFTPFCSSTQTHRIWAMDVSTSARPILWSNAIFITMLFNPFSTYEQKWNI